MKMRSLLLILSGVVASAGWAEFLDEDTKGLRVDLVLDENSFDYSNWGVEGGFGVSLFPLDEVGIFAGYRENDSRTALSGGVFVEENYPIDAALVPFAGLAAGYGETDSDYGEEEGDVFVRVQGGLKFLFSDNKAVALTLSYSASPSEIFPGDRDPADHAIDLRLGMRFYY